MNAAEVMGCFLRVWRARWVGLSRAQLAIAVSAGAKAREPVTVDMVRKWERGQPPKTAATLEALVAAMEGRGLTRPEAGHFRQVVFAACAAQRYPELFPSEDFIHRPDVDWIAACLADGELSAPASVNAVTLVHAAAQLERAVKGRRRPGVPGSQERRQEAALGNLQATLSWYLGATGRHRQAARQAGANVSFLQLRFGPGGVRRAVRVRDQRVFWTMERGLSTNSPRAIEDLLALSSAFAQAGEADQAALTKLTALGLATWCDWPEARAMLRAEAAACLEAAASSLGSVGLADGYLRAFEATLADGTLQEAERYAAGFREWKDHPGSLREAWSTAMGRYAMVRGDHHEALAHFEESLKVAAEWGLQEMIPGLMDYIARCDRSRAAARRPRPLAS